jgi:aquaporin Z
MRIDLVRRHWPEYLSEAWGLAFFMVSACGFGVLLFHPTSPLVALIPDPFVRRGLMGVAMALTALVNVHSPWGRRSGCHLNPAVTLTFMRLGKVDPADAAWYVVAQFTGGIGGAALAALALSMWLEHPDVNYVATVPGPGGPLLAFAAELAISFGLMLTVLAFTSRAHLARFTGLAVALLIALYITFESPLSGMSMNPARTVGSAVLAWTWDGLWLYFAAPVLGMLLAAAFLTRGTRLRATCAKLDHDTTVPCIFCRFHARRGPGTPRGASSFSGHDHARRPATAAGRITRR